MKGKGALLKVAKEVALIKAWSDLHFVVAHLLACKNEVADALSRLAAEPPKSFPVEGKHVPHLSAASVPQLFAEEKGKVCSVVCVPFSGGRFLGDFRGFFSPLCWDCLLYTSDAADDTPC
eukprot:6265879-Amphidinium_carterae.1